MRWGLVGAAVALLVPFLLTFTIAIPMQYVELMWASLAMLGGFLGSWKFRSIGNSIAIGLLVWLSVLLYWGWVYDSPANIPIYSSGLSSSPSLRDPLTFVRSSQLYIYPLITFLLSTISGGALARAVFRMNQALSHRGAISETEKRRMFRPTVETPRKDVSPTAEVRSETHYRMDLRTANFQCKCGELFATANDAKAHLKGNPSHKVHRLGFERR